MKRMNLFRFLWQALEQLNKTGRNLHHWKFLVRYSIFIFFTVFVLSLVLVTLLDRSVLLAQEEPYYTITGPCRLGFPEDHGGHSGYRTEWWYYTGNLRSENGREYGFQLTFFRRQMSPPGTEKTWPQPKSAWRTQQLFLAHAALTDINGKQFHHAEQMSREMRGLAGALQEDGVTAVYVGNWSSRMEGNKHRLEAAAEGFGLNLHLASLKAPVLHGDAGYSRKGAAPESASCYYSLTRLQADGEISLGAASFSVHGTGWMDHEFSSAPLEPNIAGWDWFSLQLSNNSELMVYLLRKKDGSISDVSSGTFVDASGKVLYLARDVIRVEVLDHWQSPRSGTVYPSRWRVSIVPANLELIVHPKLPDQELETPQTTGITYWEGSVTASGKITGSEVSGEGYVELTGYAAAMDDRM
jgi:predicted secreted hydrolase